MRHSCVPTVCAESAIGFVNGESTGKPVTSSGRARHVWVWASIAGLLLSAGGCGKGGGESATAKSRSGEAAPVVVGTKPKSWTGYLDGKPVEVAQGTLGDEATIERIIDEGMKRNQVMSHLEYLSQNIGSRLTGSKRAQRANEWTRDRFASWGLSNVHLDQWGTVGLSFDRGPSSGDLYVEENVRIRRQVAEEQGKEPTAPPKLRKARALEFTTLSWTRGTNGPVRGEVIRMPRTAEELEQIKEKMNGAWVLIPAGAPGGMRDIRGRVADQYADRAKAREAAAKGEELKDPTMMQRVAVLPVAGFISSSRDERVWTGGIRGWRELTMETIPPEVHVQVRMSDYDYLNSRIADGERVWAEFDLKHEFAPGPVPVYNTVAEIRGTEKPDEVVFVSGHLDSWDGVGSQGATDNGTGSAVTLEAARILMASGAKPKRTIRFILWTGEEQGLLGSLSYVERHKNEWAKWSACFVDDGGTDSQGGLGASTDEMARILVAATAPVNGLFFDSADGKALNVNVRMVKSLSDGVGGSDHASFVRSGIPGFFWDEVGRADYGFGWHTQNDKITLAILEYLKQSATCSAITAYRLANAPELLPREPKKAESEGEGDAPRPRRQREGTGGAGGAGGASGGSSGGGASGGGSSSGG